MPEYRGTEALGIVYQRAKEMIFSNPLHGPPVLRVEEESVLRVADREIVEPVGGFSVIADDDTLYYIDEIRLMEV